jgi:hypothetical protein
MLFAKPNPYQYLVQCTAERVAELVSKKVCKRSVLRRQKSAPMKISCRQIKISCKWVRALAALAFRQEGELPPLRLQKESKK